MNNYALRIYKNDNELLTVLTTRIELKINSKLEVENDLSLYNGKKYVLYDITTQKEVRSGVIGQKISEDVKGETKKGKADDENK